MSGVIGIPDKEPWLVAGWAFRLILERTTTQLSDPADAREVEQAIALHGLHFKFLPQGQGLRLARALFKVAADLRPELLASADSRDQSLAGYLVTLQSQLDDAYDLSGSG